MAGQNFTEEEIRMAKETSLTELAAHYGFHPRRVGNTLFTLQEHDSVRIYNDRTWYRWSRAGNGKESGGSQIDFLMQFCHVASVSDAIRILLEFQGVYRGSRAEKKYAGEQHLLHQAGQTRKTERAAFILPEAVEGDYRRVYAYLTRTRGLSRKVVDYFTKDLKILYEEKEHHNLVFLGKDRSGAVRYATKRGTADIYGKKYRGDVAGNDKNYGINIVNGNSDDLKVFEANIDLMSYLDITGDYESNKLVLGGTADNPLVQFLKDYQHIRKIGFCLDNDRAGKLAVFGALAESPDETRRRGLLDKYRELGYQTYAAMIPEESGCKDWNEYLIYSKSGNIRDNSINTGAESRWKDFIQQHQDMVEQLKKKGKHRSLVINAFGGPGAGKSTACFHIVEELKKKGYVVEYVSEYAKDLVWEENFTLLDGSEEHQFEILKEQMHRIDRLYGKVDFIVTDASILLNAVYNRELTPEYGEMLGRLNDCYENFNFLVQRGDRFETEGRIHSYEESIIKDREVEELLGRYHLFYGVYKHETLDQIVQNVQVTHGRLETSGTEGRQIYRNTRKAR